MIYCFTITVEVGPAIEIGATARGRRMVIPILGGSVEGPRFSGHVLPAGADYQLLRADGVMEVDARYCVESSAGRRLYVENKGIRVATPDDTERLLQGEPVDPSRVYFTTNPTFETSAPELEWMTRRLFIASGEREPDIVRLRVFEVA